MATKVVLVIGAVLLVLLCWLAIRGFSPAIELLVTFGALFLMIAGGSWFTGKLGFYGRGRGRRPVAAAGQGAPAPRTPPTATTAAHPTVAEADRHCPGAELAGRSQRPEAGSRGA